MKNSYILLRNNKESAALSIEELQEIGLKETDLIWVECQSMDWRSPFEIAELKNLVSASDKEIKKNGTENLIPLEMPNREDLVKTRGTGNIWTKPPIENFENYNHPGQVSLSGPEKTADFMLNKSSTTAEIKGTYFRNQGLEGQLKNKRNFAFQLPERVKKITLYTGLILTGALLMLLIKNVVSKRPPAVQQTKALPEKNVVSTAAVSSVPKDTAAIDAANIGGPDLSTGNSSVTPVKERKRPAVVTDNIPLKTDATAANPDSSIDNVKKITKPATEIKAKPVTMEDISSKIGLEANNYNVGVFGGIRNLKMTLQNGSKYMLDKVTVELKYLNSDDKIVNTEQLYFQNIPPQDVVSLDVDKSKRGVKVEYHVIKIECRALTSSQLGLAGSGN